jgi:hypothetical protein
MRAGTGWSDVIIGNVSRRGMMLRCPVVPKHGAVVEISYRGGAVVGRVVWSSHDRCGVRTQEPIDLMALLARQTGSRRAVQQSHSVACLPSEALQRWPGTQDTSQRIATLLNWTSVLVGGTALAIAFAEVASEVLFAMTTQVSSALARGPSNS